MLFHAHSGLRYLVLATAAVAALWLLANVLRRRPLDRGARIASAVFVGALDLQILLGVALVLSWPWYSALAGHLTMMLLAGLVAHGVAIVNKRRPEAQRSSGLALAGVVVPLVLVVGGILAIGRPVV